MEIDELKVGTEVRRSVPPMETFEVFDAFDTPSGPVRLAFDVASPGHRVAIYDEDLKSRHFEVLP